MEPAWRQQGRGRGRGQEGQGERSRPPQKERERPAGRGGRTKAAAALEPQCGEDRLDDHVDLRSHDTESADS